jgi:hypothetical protein
MGDFFVLSLREGWIMSDCSNNEVDLRVVLTKEALAKIGGQSKLAELIAKATGCKQVHVSTSRSPMGWGFPKISGPTC